MMYSFGRCFIEVVVRWQCLFMISYFEKAVNVSCRLVQNVVVFIIWATCKI